MIDRSVTFDSAAHYYKALALIEHAAILPQAQARAQALEQAASILQQVVGHRSEYLPQAQLNLAIVYHSLSAGRAAPTQYVCFCVARFSPFQSFQRGEGGQLHQVCLVALGDPTRAYSAAQGYPVNHSRSQGEPECSLSFHPLTLTTLTQPSPNHYHEPP